MSDAFAVLQGYVGNRHAAVDVVTVSQVARVAATLDVEHPAPNAGDPIPDGWHVAFFPPLARRAKLRPDGQPIGGGLTPVIPLPRRTLAGVSSTYHGPLRIGDEIERVTEVAAIDVGPADGPRTVRMTMRESISTPRGLAVVDEREVLFYGEDGPGSAEDGAAVPTSASWSRTYEPDPVTLFRASAVRFNAHRIHYDRRYVTEEEGYPGLVVPVSLVSLQMLEMMRAGMTGRQLASFGYRARRPIFDLGPYRVSGAPDGPGAVLWAIGHDGELAMTATATFR